MFSRWALYRISYRSRIWIWMTVLISDHWSCLNVNAVLWTYSRISYRTALTALEFGIWHAFIVVLIWVLLNILEIDGITVRLSSCRSWTLHYQVCLVMTILRSIWSNSKACLNSHGWIMLVKHLLSNNYLICWCRSCRSLFLQTLRIFRGIVGWMKRMDWTSTLCRKLRSHLRGPKAIILAVLLSEVLFDL